MFRVICLVLSVFAAVCKAEVLEIASRPGDRIVGGSDASIYDFPHQISLRYKGRHRCGGSIYSANIVVCSIVCVQSVPASQMTIVAGSTFLSDPIIEIPIKEVILHPKHKTTSKEYDVSILVLSELLRFGPGIQPIPLAKERPPAGTIATFTGWGYLQHGGTFSDQLQKFDVIVISQAECRKIYQISLTGKMICAGVPDGSKDVCEGDAGGPLIVNNQLLGIAPWEIPCAQSDNPRKYTSIPDVYGWMEETAQQYAVSFQQA